MMYDKTIGGLGCWMARGDPCGRAGVPKEALWYPGKREFFSVMLSGSLVMNKRPPLTHSGPPATLSKSGNPCSKLLIRLWLYGNHGSLVCCTMILFPALRRRKCCFTPQSGGMTLLKVYNNKERSSQKTLHDANSALSDGNAYILYHIGDRTDVQHIVFNLQFSNKICSL